MQTKKREEGQELVRRNRTSAVERAGFLLSVGGQHHNLGEPGQLYFADLEADFCIITEHRQVKAGAAKMQLQLEAAGWRAAVTEGKTTEVGVSGGTLVV